MSEELVPITVEDVLEPRLPRSIQKVPLPAACAAFARIAALEKRTSPVRCGIIEHLFSVVGYSLFDMSYEGHYMQFLPNDPPLFNEEKLEIERAVKEIKGWRFRKVEEWIRDLLVDIYT
ncbi:hypothetical protein C8A03DRAFT_37255 [Achaetomium macrosporum]|uniref:Uncharacterized protein n=1 Tax=Achaetomium macrosporum TaxID=79813 RepID=A0AAN7H4S0_9PEZI|nr:hypothetical protein C8A03DRAFT_37255 [Achaetomium macrosporum]